MHRVGVYVRSWSARDFADRHRQIRLLLGFGLSKFDKTGALTVAIIPLVALMAHQVQGPECSGISSGVIVNGMLSMPERQDSLGPVRMGEASILLSLSGAVAEHLRAFRAEATRSVGLWILKKAHYVSKWEHGFPAELSLHRPAHS